MADQARGDDTPHLIVADDPDPAIGHHAEDWIAFAIFWGMAIIVFLQFFTRYLLMWVTFVGAAIAMRRGTHIAVEVAHVFLPALAVRVLNFAIDVMTVGFIGLLCWFGIEITRRMQIQTMAVINWPMSIVYAGVTVGCFLMLWRAIQRFVSAMRRGWRPDPNRAELIID